MTRDAALATKEDPQLDLTLRGPGLRSPSRLVVPLSGSSVPYPNTVPDSHDQSPGSSFASE